MGMGGEPGDPKKAEWVQVLGELVQIGTIDPGIDRESGHPPPHPTWHSSRPTRSTGAERLRHLIEHRSTL
jgi:hypothetical protein